MPRTKTYDDKKARSGLLTAFHENGYSDTSLVDMESSSGLNRRQLYNDYGDKKSIFIQAINDFSAIAGQVFLRFLEHGDQGVQDIRKTVNILIKAAETDDKRLGCMVCNSVSEPIAKEKEINQQIDQYFIRIQQAYQKALVRAVNLNELSKDTDVLALSRFFLATHVGLCVLCRAGQSIDALQSIGSEALKKLR